LVLGRTFEKTGESPFFLFNLSLLSQKLPPIGAFWENHNSILKKFFITLLLLVCLSLYNITFRESLEAPQIRYTITIKVGKAVEERGVVQHNTAANGDTDERIIHKSVFFIRSRV
jgi:hypothetical protein